MTFKSSPLTVLVTGATGMIGRRLVPALVAAGHHVICVVRDISKCKFDSTVEVLTGDLTDLNFCEIAMSKMSRPWAIIHLAGMGSIVAAEADPHSAAVINVQITESLLAAATAKNISRFLFASTGMVYGPGHLNSIDENVLPNPISVYAKTKYKAELSILRYAKENKISAEILRFSNVYGPESSEKTVIGRILSQLRLKQHIQVQDVSPVRDFVFVDDVVTAFLSLLTLTDLPGCEITNISSGVGLNIGTVVDAAKTLSGEFVESSKQQSLDKGDHFILSNDKLWRRTGWRPQINIREGLKLSLDHSNYKELQ